MIVFLKKKKEKVEMLYLFLFDYVHEGEERSMIFFHYFIKLYFA